MYYGIQWLSMQRVVQQMVSISLSLKKEPSVVFCQYGQKFINGIVTSNQVALGSLMVYLTILLARQLHLAQ